MNRAAEHQVRTSNAIRVTNNHLAPIDRMARLALAKAIDEATGDEADLPTSGFTIALPGADNAGLIATILPLARGERQSIRGAFSGMVAIFVQDPVVMPPFPGEAFAELYGLTRSELRVLLAMAPGLSVKEAAEMLGIGENTAKTHLQHIHSKTGTSKQTELMRLFMSSTPPVNAGQQPAGRALGEIPAMSPLNSWGLRLALRRCAQKLKVVSRCFQRGVDLKRLTVVRDGLSFVVHRLVGPA